MPDREGPARARCFPLPFGIVLLAAAASGGGAARGASPPDPSWTGDGNQTSAHYGHCVATAGDVNGDGFSDVIVGARNYDAGQANEGRAYVYHGGPGGLSPTADWTAESDQLLAFFGQAVAPAGDVNGDGYADVIVGAPAYDGSLQNEGRAYVFLGSATGLASTPAWTRDGGQANATFGNSVGTAGDVNGDGYDDIVVGARGFDGAAPSAGRAYVFLGSATGPDTSAAWFAEVAQEDAAFGWSVGTAGDVNGDGYADVIVGAFFYDGALTDEGAAFVYLGSASGPGPSPAWTARGNQAGATFGWSVGTAGDVNGDGYADVIVGARYHSGALADEGRAYVFLGSATGADSSASWSVDGGEVDAYLGWSVGTAGDVNGDGYADVIVGAPRTDDVWLDAGRALVFAGSAEGLGSTPLWTVGSGQAGACLGWSVAGAGDVDGDGFGDVLAAAHLHDDGQTDEGRVWLFPGGARLPAPAPAWRASGGPSAGSYGAWVDYAGDVNGDGFTDLLASDPFFSGGEVGEGRVDLFLGSESGPDVSPDWTAEGNQVGAALGRSVAGAGDVNGDGYGDVLVGVPLHDATFPDGGRAILFLGSAAGLSSFPSWEALGEGSSFLLGHAVAGAGDVNGDGYADVLVGAYQQDGVAAGAGAVLVYHGSASGLPPQADLILEGVQSGAQFGYSVAGAGDVDGDGFSDVLVGEPAASAGEIEEGRSYLYRGSPGGLVPVPAWTNEADQAGARLGDRVAGAGDVDGDGYADVLVGARLFDAGETDEGRVFLYRGTPVGLEVIAAWTAEANQAGAELGTVRSAGDVDGDGYGDVLLGAPRFTGAATWEGKVSLHLGDPTGLSGVPALEITGGSALAQLGAQVAGRGDPDGDGWSDLLLGAPGFADSVTGGGVAFLHPGNGGGGATRAVRQMHEGGAGEIALLGFSDSGTGFRLEALGRSAGGRARVALEWEVKRLGVPFDGSTQVGTVTDTGPPVPGTGSRVSLAGAVAGLSASRPYRWRLRFRGASPYFPTSPWFHHPGNGATETDLRTFHPPVAAGERPERSSAGLHLAVGPTPFRGRTVARFLLPTSGAARLTVHDVAGRLVATLQDGLLPAGVHVRAWDGESSGGGPVVAGVYVLRLEAAGRSRSLRVVLVR